MRKEKQRRWFDLAKALHERLHIRLGTAAWMVRRVAIVWLYLSAKECPPRWLFAIGRGIDRVLIWVQIGIVRLQIWCLRRKMARVKGEITMLEVKEEFRARCLIWSQIGMLMLICLEFDASKCDRMGGLAGRVVRYGRTFDSTNKHETAMATDAIDQVRMEFSRLPQAAQSEIVTQVFRGIDLAPDAEIKQKIRNMLKKEIERLTQNAVKCVKCDMGIISVEHVVGCPKRRDN